MKKKDQKKYRRKEDTFKMKKKQEKIHHKTEKWRQKSKNSHQFNHSLDSEMLHKTVNEMNNLNLTQFLLFVFVRNCKNYVNC